MLLSRLRSGGGLGLHREVLTLDETMLRQSVGAQIRLYRELQGISVEKLAKAIGVSAQQLSRVEKGVLGTPYPRLARIAELLRVRVGDLFPDRWRAEVVPLETALVQYGLSPENVACVQKIVAALHWQERFSE